MILSRLFTPAVQPISTNPYFIAALEAFKKSKPSDPRPSPPPAEILAIIMQGYLDRVGNRTGIGSRNHDADAIAIQKLIFEKKSDQTYVYINNLANMKADSAFSIALGTFFSIYPEHFTAITTPAVRSAIASNMNTALWQPAAKLKLDALMEAHLEAKDSPDFERLAALSLSIPDDRVNDYADFLLKLLQQKRANESHPGLYRGWVMIALGNLHHRPLSFKKKETIIKTLQQELGSSKMSLSSIGLCDALANISSDKRQAADFLIKYLTSEFQHYFHLYKDHHVDPTLTAYMPKIFQAITNLTHAFESAQKEKIIALFTKPENIYLMREGIQAIHGWLSTEQKINLQIEINNHEQFTPLVCALYEGIRHEKTNPLWPMQKRYWQGVETAKVQLTDADIRKVRVLEQVRLLSTDAGTCDKELTDIIQNLLVAATQGNPKRAEGEQLLEIYSALASLSERCQEHVRVNMAGLLHKAIFEWWGDNTTEMQIKIATTSLKFLKQLSTNQERALSTKLLAEVDGSAAPAAATRALENYAKEADHRKLPELMMHLLAMDHPHAQFLLTEVEHLYQERLPIPANAPQLK